MLSKVKETKTLNPEPFKSTASNLPEIETIRVIGLPVAATNYQKAIEWIKVAALKNDRKGQCEDKRMDDRH